MAENGEKLFRDLALHQLPSFERPGPMARTWSGLFGKPVQLSTDGNVNSRMKTTSANRS